MLKDMKKYGWGQIVTRINTQFSKGHSWKKSNTFTTKRVGVFVTRQVRARICGKKNR